MKSDVISYYAFLPTLWGQGAPYNSTVPYLCSNGRAPVGCVPVAIGQVMAYHGTPSNLDWTSILKSSVITSNSSQTVIDQVSNLLVEIGSRINISYTGFFYINNPPAFQTGSRIWSCIRIITDIRKF